MNIKQIFSEALERASSDVLIEKGILDISKQEHVEILREHLTDANLDADVINFYLNKMLEGKYPDRQAYNANGLLVTFPTPEYKQRAISRGTHFEENPKKAAGANIFEPQPEQPSTEPPPKTEPQQPAQSTSEPTFPTEPTPDTPAPETTAEKNKNEPDLRTSQEKQSDAQVIQKILTTEYTLDEANTNGFYRKGLMWYTTEGIEVGVARYVEDLGKIIIRPRR